MSTKILKYETIAFDLRKKILSGFYKQNDQLPLEKEMCEEYDTSRITVKKAMDQLVLEGLVVKRRGAGTFVKDVENPDADVLQSMQFMGFSEENKHRNVSSDILKFEIINPDESTLNKLRISELDFVYRIIRVRKIDKKPHAIEECFMPINLISGLRMDIVASSIYTYIESVLGFSIQSAHKTVSAMMPTEFEKEYLKIADVSPILNIEQVAYLDNGQPFEYSNTKYRADKYEFHAINIR
ncbi:GntR family transcriptional regulator [Listeria ivanovii]|uniref:GntR family transcriptional regulator n=1 Tax=Listeria ivanovii TaxID=1638 RepID=UPI001FB3E5D6|nr:GntR family transcriptional regulator [Listeria ivanovii]MCJ1735638.1 GntR family transcriptional regulator [Listeria ivanovii]